MRTAFAVLATLAALPAAAHSGHDAGTAFSAGLAHPLTGLDHLLGMLGIGLWSAQQKQPLSLALATLGAMSVGALAFGGAALPALGEMSLSGGVALTGVLLAWGVRVPVSAAAVLVAGLALLHGQAHGAQLPGAASAAGYLLASAALIVAGRLAAPAALHRPAGMLMGAAGLGLLAGFA